MNEISAVSHKESIRTIIPYTIELMKSGIIIVIPLWIIKLSAYLDGNVQFLHNAVYFPFKVINLEFSSLDSHLKSLNNRDEKKQIKKN